LASIFGRLGRAVIRHHKAIIVIWVVIFLALIGFAPLASQAVVYDSNSGSGRELLESAVAKQWMTERFGQVTDQGSVIIVLSSSTVTDGNARDTVMALNKAITSSQFTALDDRTSPSGASRSTPRR